MTTPTRPPTALEAHREVCGFYASKRPCLLCAMLEAEAIRGRAIPFVRIVAGRSVLTLSGINELRSRFSLEPIRVRPGETIPAFKERAKRETAEFFAAHPELADFSPNAAPRDEVVSEPSDGAAKSQGGSEEIVR